ncbi:Asp-tRNA(Asn)/Glu-tRNA(Gln) amidotransferase subunit GatC [candidate division KSB1 bacterium]|jgi:aspartyl-tRNA(Asn)/glutamyl-tRNA(Gln) amidotransferase subunit C|nr:Asp-tRNA(Asn)/Glu-tRNA(Gln) amidotransferase subunit GatC [candidate division KSB1 bacterium]
MMSVSRDQVKNIARLAKLQFSPQEEDHFTEQFNQILSYVEKLDELDTESVDPTTHVLDLNNVLREDKVVQWLTQDQALANAPLKKSGFFSVPKVIG